MRPQAVLKIASVLGLVLLAGCPKKTAVWVKGGSTVSNLVLGLSNTRGGADKVLIGVLRVDGCGQPNDTRSAAQWVMTSTDDAQPISEVTYGHAPSGYTTTEGPLPLAPGCYQVTISGTGRSTFQVDSGGAVVEERK